VSTFRHITVRRPHGVRRRLVGYPAGDHHAGRFFSMAVSAPFAGSGRDLSSKSCVGAVRKQPMLKRRQRWREDRKSWTSYFTTR
jgi:hypothetical protein